MSYDIEIDWNLLWSHIQDMMTDELKRRVNVHTGALKDSINVRIVGEKIEIFMLPYALPVEFGSTPHYVLPSMLEQWCEDKLGSRSYAEWLSKHILIKGTAPHPFIRPYINEEITKHIAYGLQQEGVINLYINNSAVQEQ